MLARHDSVRISIENLVEHSTRPDLIFDRFSCKVCTFLLVTACDGALLAVSQRWRISCSKDWGLKQDLQQHWNSGMQLGGNFCVLGRKWNMDLCRILSVNRLFTAKFLLYKSVFLPASTSHDGIERAWIASLVTEWFSCTLKTWAIFHEFKEQRRYWESPLPELSQILDTLQLHSVAKCV